MISDGTSGRAHIFRVVIPASTSAEWVWLVHAAKRCEAAPNENGNIMAGICTANSQQDDVYDMALSWLQKYEGFIAIVNELLEATIMLNFIGFYPLVI